MLYYQVLPAYKEMIKGMGEGYGTLKNHQDTVEQLAKFICLQFLDFRSESIW